MLGMILCLGRRLLLACTLQRQSLVKLFQPLWMLWHLPIQLPKLGESSPELEGGGCALGTGDWPHRMAWFDGVPVTYLMNLIRKLWRCGKSLWVGKASRACRFEHAQSRETMEL